MHQDVTEALTPGASLAALLSTESLLFAAFALGLNMAEAAKRVYPIKPRRIAWIAAGSLGVVAFGAGAAWFAIFLDRGFPTEAWLRIVAFVSAFAIAIQPVLAFLYARAMKAPVD